MAATASDGLRIAEGLALPPAAVTETILILAKRGSGKALALGTPLPTPTGWTTMSAVKVGDDVLDERGRPSKVTFATDVMHGHVCYRVVFDDDSEIIADAEHLWLSETLASRRADGQARFYTERKRGLGGPPQCDRTARPELVTTEQIRQTLHVPVGSGGRKDRNHGIRNTAALELPAAALPIDPYVLGIWLGDGTAQSSYITTADPEVLEEIRGAGYEVGAPRALPVSGRSASYRVGAGPDGSPLWRRLRLEGLLLDKHVPAAYLRASRPQRLALLEGMMDSDGTAEAASNSCVFANTNERLADAVAELVTSLGWVARRRKRPAKLNGVEHGIAHEVRFRPDRCVFRLPRKAARFNPSAAQAGRHQRRMIIAVEPVPTVPVRCIAVDSPSHLYLAGRSMIPTHNTYAASVLVEEMVAAGLPVCVIDPVGVWWGLRSSADGQGPGLPVTILGGDHADLPLPAESGAAAADLVIDERAPVVLDLSQLSKTQQRRFACDFLERLYHRNRDPQHVVIDEADLFAPLRGGKDTMRLLGAYEDIVRRGRARGIGCTSITQRPAVLHTDIRSQSEVLIALRLIGTHDVAAIDEWVRLHASDEDARELKASLPSLPVGTAWVWSPGWLEILIKVRIRPRLTFDSSATPKIGQQVIIPRQFASVSRADLQRMAARLQADGESVPAAADTGTAALRKQVRELRAALAEARSREPERVEVPVLSEVDRRALDGALGALRDLTLKLSDLPAPSSGPVPGVPPARPRRPAAAQLPPESAAGRAQAAAGSAQLKAGAMRMLTALARRHPLKVTRAQLATLGGIKKSGGTFGSYFSTLRTAGLISEESGLVSITSAGLSTAGIEPAAPATAEEVREQWRSVLKAGARVMLDHLLDAYPASVSRTDLAEAAGLEQGGGTFGSYLSSLRSNGLAEVTGSWVRAADVFFLAEVRNDA